MQDEQFYDKVARKFGDYSSKVTFDKVFETGDPEAVFKQKLLELSATNKKALDLGCADGRFTLAISPNFKEIIAIDVSRGMLDAADQKQKDAGVTNVQFLFEDAEHTRFVDETFDIVYSRRGPTPYEEIARVLKRDGYYLETDIGEKDVKTLKEVFGRGQGFDKMDKSILPLIKSALQDNGLKIEFAEEYFYNEFYKSSQDLDLFLQGVPIFKDFDSEKDKDKLEEYVEKYQTEKGIPLRRHRIVIVAQK